MEACQPNSLTPSTLNSLYRTDLDQEISSKANWYKLYKLAAATSFVAGIALGIVVVIFSSLATSGLATIPVALALGSIAFGPLTDKAARWSVKGDNYFADKVKAEKIKKIFEQFKSFYLSTDGLNEAAIHRDFGRFGISIDREVIQQIQEHLPEKSKATQAWLGVLAHFVCSLEEAAEKIINYQSEIQELRKTPSKKANHDRLIREIENSIGPATLSTLVVLKILKDPLTAPTSWKELGNLNIKLGSSRFFEKEIQLSGHDDYFIHKQKNLVPVLLADIKEAATNLLDLGQRPEGNEPGQGQIAAVESQIFSPIPCQEPPLTIEESSAITEPPQREEPITRIPDPRLSDLEKMREAMLNSMNPKRVSTK
ncbi:MAG: hypothetical protein Q8L98_04250 [Chlamydiales bacterium]|nr:hypothetical protein [Chlamydiales bacterium]